MAAAPSGTVTLLFTDIEGSTKRWEERPAEMMVALARHDSLLRGAIEEHHGHVFKTVGDAFCAAFASAADAVAAVVAAQRALHAETWSEVGHMRVRMALHTGTPQPRDDDYFGPPVNRVARLLATGHGGQSLLSLATQELVRDCLPPEVSLRYLGEHRLKDLQQPERIFQLVVAGLPADFPALRTLDSRANNLPAQATPLVGREQELATVQQYLRQPAVRLVTLTGPGGTGKTRLSLQVAADSLDDFLDGAYFVALASLRDADLVTSAIAQAVGVPETGGQPLLQHLVSHLRDRQLLLLLDNFEQVLAAAPLVANLLAACPKLKVLVTSRAALRIRGEQEFPVPPLRLPESSARLSPAGLVDYEAVRLFVERAQATQPSFALSDENAGPVAEICRRLDGLPLAIELAAARIRVLPPQAMLSRLERRLKVLAGGARDLPERQQTMRGAIAWSYDLLGAAERKLFERLAVFVGGCTLEAVEALGDDGGDLALDALDGVESLVHHSLLRSEEQPGGEPRFLMLEMIREYGLECLQESGELAALQERHAGFFLQLAQEAEPQLTGPLQRAWLARLDLEHDNVRAALQWLLDRGQGEAALGLSLAMGQYWWTRAHWREGRGWLEKALDAPGATPAARARALYWAGTIAAWQSDLGAARALLQQSLDVCRALGDQMGICRALNVLANVASGLCDHATSRQLLEDMLAILRALGNQRGIAAALRNLGSVAHDQGDYALARQLYEEALATARQLGDRKCVAGALANLGEVAHQQGDHARARRLYEESLALNRDLGFKRDAALTLLNMGEQAILQDDHAAAGQFIAEALAALRLAEDGLGIATALGLLGELALRQGDHTLAEARLVESLATFQKLGDRRSISRALERLAYLARDQGALENTAYLLGAAAGLRRAIGVPLPPVHQARHEATLAAVRQELGDAAFATAWEEGGARPWLQVVEHALAAATNLP